MKYLHIAAQIVLFMFIVVFGISVSLSIQGYANLDLLIWPGKFHDFIVCPVIFGFVRFIIMTTGDEPLEGFEVGVATGAVAWALSVEIYQYIDPSEGYYDSSDFLAYAAGSLFCFITIAIKRKATKKQQATPISV